MSTALDLLVVLPVAALTSRRDRFRCEPYRCVMPARDCLARQAKAKIPDLSHGQRMEISKCVGCSLGAEVSARCASLDEDTGPLAHVAGDICEVRGCTQRAVTEGLCTKHLLRRYSAGRDPNAGGAVVALRCATPSPVPPPPPAVETPAATPAPETLIVLEEPPMPPKKTDPSFVALCKVRGCTEPIPGVLATTPAHYFDLCKVHRSRAQTAVKRGYATPRDVAEYLGEGNHRSDRRGSKVAAAKAPKPAAPKASVALKGAETPRRPEPESARDNATAPLSADQVALVARVIVMAQRHGVARLEALCALSTTSSLAEIVAALTTGAP